MTLCVLPLQLFSSKDVAINGFSVNARTFDELNISKGIVVPFLKTLDESDERSVDLFGVYNPYSF